jgi:hypothetical protein
MNARIGYEMTIVDLKATCAITISERDAARAEAARLVAENEKLRAALRPFAARLTSDGGVTTSGKLVDDCRRAREVLGSTP